jgi:hypothetical protein
MGNYERSVLNFAAVAQEAGAVSTAVLAGDIDEARFRTHLLVARADVAGLDGVAVAAGELLVTLGPPRTPPGVGFGAIILRLADELDAATPVTSR